MGQRLEVGVVISTVEHGGAEANIARIWTDPIVASMACAHLLGTMPNWPRELEHTDLGLGAKWSYRRAFTSLADMPRSLVRGRRHLHELHARRPFDAFYAHFKREQVLYTATLARMAPVVWMEHGHFPGGRLRGPLEAAYRRAAGHTAAIVCLSDSVRDEIDSIVGDRTELVVIENAIEPTWVTPATDDERVVARRTLGVPDDAWIVIAAVARLIPRKRLELAIDACALLPDAWLIICGAGPLDDALRARAAGNPRVVFTGHLDDPRPVYRAADVHVLLSWEEGFGHVLLESAAAGLPNVVVADGGFPERVDGWGAVAADPTAAAVASAIGQAATLPHDAPRRWAETHSPDRWAAAHLAVLHRAITR